MVKLPTPISSKHEEKGGKSVIVEQYADGAYGIKDMETNEVEINHSDGTKQYYKLLDKEEYDLYKEELPNGFIRIWGKGEKGGENLWKKGKKNIQISTSENEPITETEYLRYENSELKGQLNKLKEKMEYMEYEKTKSVSAIENLPNISDSERMECFQKNKKLLKDHPIMLEPCLYSMCSAYIQMQDADAKKEMLSDLYNIRKSGAKNKDKREMAATFKRVLDKNPNLKNDENLVALSKVDTIIQQPTKAVKKQIESR